MNISFDFDTTLKCPHSGEPNIPIVHKFLEHQTNGDNVIIVTSRYRQQMSLIEIKNFCEEHKLNPQRIIHTNGEDKTETLLWNNIDLHYDDCDHEIEECKKHNIPCIHVQLTDEQKSHEFRAWHN